MPACGSEDACLRGLWSSKGGLAAAQCSPGSGARRRRRPNGLAARAPGGSPPYTRRLLSRVARIAKKIITCSLLGPAAVWLWGWLWLASWLVSWPARLPLALLGLGLRLARARRGGELAGRAPADPRCVLVSGASSPQAVRLARHLSSAGARVVLAELDGLLALGRFSRACSRFYGLPRPGPGSAAEYVAALRDIVLRERCSAYVPVSAASSAYYDALAKPHLERLGCECFVPGAAELGLLDDPLELLGRARLLGLPLPCHRLLDAGLPQAALLYAEGALAARRHYALAAGPPGLRERGPELRLPPSLAEFDRLRAGAAAHDAPGRPWLVLADPGGTHFVTCTTVRDSRLLANVTCRVDEARGALVPERRPEVERWLERFFSRGFPGAGRISGHLSFRLAASEDRPDLLVALGCKVGLGLPYLGYTGQQARLLWRPCGHRSARPGPRPECVEGALVGRPLDKREALFLYWDPLPYCLYCCLQLPVRRLAGALGAHHQNQHKPPLAVVQ